MLLTQQLYWGFKNLKLADARYHNCVGWILGVRKFNPLPLSQGRLWPLQFSVSRICSSVWHSCHSIRWTPPQAIQACRWYVLLVLQSLARFPLISSPTLIFNYISTLESCGNSGPICSVQPYHPSESRVTSNRATRFCFMVSRQAWTAIDLVIWADRLLCGKRKETPLCGLTGVGDDTPHPQCPTCDQIDFGYVLVVVISSTSYLLSKTY